MAATAFSEELNLGLLVAVSTRASLLRPMYLGLFYTQLSIHRLAVIIHKKCVQRGYQEDSFDLPI